jgi:hypothetical protein
MIFLSSFTSSYSLHEKKKLVYRKHGSVVLVNQSRKISGADAASGACVAVVTLTVTERELTC